MLCAALEEKRILAVSDVACVGRSGCFGPGVGVLSSYDRAWTENGGAPGADGFFELAPRPARRALAEVPSRKRAEHRRRFVMLDELADRIHRAVEHASATFQAPKGAAAETNRPPSDSWSGDFAISAFSRF
jgi:uncharacterized protein VirK/YbjX